MVIMPFRYSADVLEFVVGIVVGASAAALLMILIAPSRRVRAEPPLARDVEKGRMDAAAADEIASMPGVDMLWLGHNDFTVAMGEPGAFDHPDFLNAEKATIAAAKKHGKSTGRLAVDARQAAQFVKLGYDFVSIAGDVWLLQQAFAAGVETIRRES